MQNATVYFNIHDAKICYHAQLDEVANASKPITIIKAGTGTPKVMIVPRTETKTKRQMEILKGKN